MTRKFLCKNCGNPVSDDMRYCPHCGEPVRHSRTEISEEEGRDKKRALLVIALLVAACTISWLVSQHIDSFDALSEALSTKHHSADSHTATPDSVRSTARRVVFSPDSTPATPVGEMTNLPNGPE